jgi:hypothetical protein
VQANVPIPRLFVPPFSLLNDILMGVQVGRVLGQIAKRRTARFNRLAYANSFVRRRSPRRQRPLSRGGLVDEN